jgi:hypothetical protein
MEWARGIWQVQEETKEKPGLHPGSVLFLDEYADEKEGEECRSTAAIQWAHGEGDYVPGGHLFGRNSGNNYAKRRALNCMV